jgi:oligopeptide/dipeptide ABC transporter ATP-binding protein
VLKREPVVRIVDVCKEFSGRVAGGKVVAVSNVSFDIYPGETLGLVGESGSGKTTLARILIGLTECTSGHVLFDGMDLSRLSRKKQNTIRRNIQMVFQDPFSSLNPRMTVGQVLARPLKIHKIASGQKLTKRIAELLEMVGLRREHAYRYPHELSGGQQQRVGIARALSLGPKLTILDEPTSALDVSVQAQILSLLKKLQRELNLTFMFISHDLSVIQYLSDRIAVMNLGRVMELGNKILIVQTARHPYTRLLLGSVPRFYRPSFPPPEDVSAVNHDLVTDGCAFEPRCTYHMEVCRHQTPKLKLVDNEHYVACFLDARGV